jgi:hypothetical protein
MKFSDNKLEYALLGLLIVTLVAIIRTIIIANHSYGLPKL